ncbi:hypothetical protein BDR26DRAFT_862622 [Obelidium mucronatum]|nr:hypothetical protein BDR26DRAFT_862622 [Obelidium mucronatum]
MFKLPTHCTISAFYVDEDGDSIQIDTDSELKDLAKLERIPKLTIAISSDGPDNNPVINTVSVEPVAPAVVVNSLPRHQDPFADILPEEQDATPTTRSETPLSRVPTALVQETQHPAPIPVDIAYPSLFDLETQNAIAMHDVESVAPSDDSPMEAPALHDHSSTTAIGVVGGEGKIPGSFPTQPSNVTSTSRDQPQGQQPQQEQEPQQEQQEQPQQVLLIDLSEIIAAVQKLAEKVTRDPEFMNSAIKTLHEFAESSKSTFEDLIRLFNEMVAGHRSAQSNNEAAPSSKQPPRYSVVFDGDLPSVIAQSSEKKPFIIRFDETDRNRQQPTSSSSSSSSSSTSNSNNGFHIRFNPPTPPQPPSVPSPPAAAAAPQTTWSSPIHICTGITDECRRFHNDKSFTPTQGFQRAAQQAQRAAQLTQLAAQQAHAQAATHAESAQSAANAFKAAIERVIAGVSNFSTTATTGTGTTNPQDLTPRWKYTTCDVCGSKGFTGPRYKCQTCRDYDICGVCYYTMKQSGGSGTDTNYHDASHEFTRIDHMNESNRSVIEGQVDQVIAMGVAGAGTSRKRVRELVVHFGGDLDRVVEVLIDENV